MAGNAAAQRLILPTGARARKLALRRRARRRRIARAVALVLLFGTVTAVVVKESRASSAFPQQAINERISAPAADDVMPNQGGFAPAMSADGRYVAYLATVTNPGLTFPTTNIYVTDRATRTRSLVPMAEFPAGGPPAPVQTLLAATDISNNGRFIAFETTCSECNDTVGITDRGNPIVTPPPLGFYPVTFAPVSGSCSGAGVDTQQRLLGMSGGGTQILLHETCFNAGSLVSDGVVVWDRTKPAGAQIVGVPVPTDDAFGAAAGPREASISSSGSRVAIVGVLTPIGCELVCPAPQTQVFVWNRDVDGNGVLDEANSATTVRESLTLVPHDFPGPREVAISGNGRIVAVTNLDTIPNPNPSRNLLDVWIVDTSRPPATSTTRLTRTNNAQLGQSYAPSLSFDGRYVAFVSTGTHFVTLPPDNPAFVCGQTTGVLCRVYLADRIGVGGAPIFELASEGMVDGSFPDTETGTNIPVSPPSPDDNSFGAVEEDFPSISLPPGLPPAISANGRLVAFESDAGNLVGSAAECDAPTAIGQSCNAATQGEDHDSDVFVHDTQPGLQGTPNPSVFPDTTINTTSIARIVTFRHKRDPNSYGRVTIPANGGVTITGPNASQFALVPADTCAGAVIDAGGSCVVRVVFKPTQAAPAFADLVVHYDGNDQPATVRLTGTGTSRVIVQQTALSPNLDFGKNVLTVAKTLTTTLRNVAGVPLTGLSVSVSPAVSHFTPSNGCGVTLVAGASCAIKVTFTAANLQPSPIETADLVVTTTTPSVPAMSISLRGEAAQPTIRVLPAVSYPGGVVQVVGQNWPPSQHLKLDWLNTVGDGPFPGVQALNLPVVVSSTFPDITRPDKDQFKWSVLVFPRADVGSRKLDAHTSTGAAYHALLQPVLLVQTPQVTGELNFVFRDG